MPRAKRAAEAEVEAPPPKKANPNPLLVGVLDGLKRADNLPESCRAMLVAAAPGCLCTPPAERHEAQALFVGFIGEAIDSVCASLEASLAAIKAATEKTGEARAGLVGKIEDAKALRQKRETEVACKEEAVSAAGAARDDAQLALAEVKRLQEEGDARLVQAGKDKQEFEAALERVKLLQEEEGFEAGQAAEHVSVLEPIAKRLELDDSLVIALPTASSRQPSKRGRFDCMVLEQLQTGLVNGVARLSSELEEGTPGMQERADSVGAAQTKLESVEKERAAAIDELVAAQNQAQLAAQALACIETSLSTFDTNHSADVRAREEEQAAAALQNFKGYNVECFSMLRDQVKDAPAAED